MRGLAFPSNAVYNRDVSYDREHDTPQGDNNDAIPIDPALSGNAIDPAIMKVENRTVEVQVCSERALTPENASSFAKPGMSSDHALRVGENFCVL